MAGAAPGVELADAFGREAADRQGALAAGTDLVRLRCKLRLALSLPMSLSVAAGFTFALLPLDMATPVRRCRVQRTGGRSRGGTNVQNSSSRLGVAGYGSVVADTFRRRGAWCRLRGDCYGSRRRGHCGDL
jgi:hypothetical protein